MNTPFTLLTGFLGAGKTTALNRLLSGFATRPRGRRVAVLVNELGRVSIDNRLIVGASGDVIELAGGCLCCKLDLRSDLWGGIVDIIERSSPDHVILETTGIAEPPSILTGLDHFEVRKWVSPAGVVCVVDAANEAAALDEQEEAALQLGCADRVLLSKLDLAAPTSIEGSHKKIRALNDDAEIAGFPATDSGDASLGEWVCEVRELRAAKKRPAHQHSHHGRQISAATFVDVVPLTAEPLLALTRELAADLLRIKGFVHIANEPRRGLLDLAGGRVELAFGTAWAADETPRSELVFIGEGVEDEAIRRRVWACASTRDVEGSSQELGGGVAE